MVHFKFAKASALACLTVLVATTAQAGSAKVTLGSQQYALNDVTCEGGPESFSVKASVNAGAELLQLGAFKGEVNSVGFRAGDTMAQVSDQTGTFDGSTFRFQGEAQVYTMNSINRQTLDVSVTCN